MVVEGHGGGRRSKQNSPLNPHALRHLTGKRKLASHWIVTQQSSGRKAQLASWPWHRVGSGVSAEGTPGLASQAVRSEGSLASGQKQGEELLRKASVTQCRESEGLMK